MGLLKLYVMTELVISSITDMVKRGGRNITVELFVLFIITVTRCIHQRSLFYCLV